MANKLIALFSLYDSFYGERGNAKTLSVILREDNTLAYSFYDGWQNSGMGFSISNLQMKKSLPSTINDFRNTDELIKDIILCLKSGLGCNDIKSIKRLNDIESQLGVISFKDELHRAEDERDELISAIVNYVTENEREENNYHDLNHAYEHMKKLANIE